jgi:bifunctional non-homologous end joining protein LigD
VTRRDVVRHHAVMAPALLAYLAERPLDIVRFPGGPGGRVVHPRTIPGTAPPWVRRWSDGRREHVVADSAATLAWLATWDVLELRPSTATIAEPGRPTWAHLDIAPGPSGDPDPDAIVELARLHRTALDHLGLDGRPVLTGDGGVRIWVPIAARHDHRHVHEWVAAVARAIGDTVPDVVGGPGIRLGPPPSAPVAPFSPLAAPGAPVAVPLAWDELDAGLPAGWTIGDVGARLRRAGDPLAPLLGSPQRLPSL